MSSDQENTEKHSIELDSFRKSLREIDDEIMGLVMRRMQIVKDIGSLKKRSGIQILDRNREDFNKLRNQQITKGVVSAEWVDQFTDLLAAWARDIQSQMK